MLFIARVEGTYGVHFVRLAPMGVRFEVNARPRPAIDMLVALDLEGLTGVNQEALDAWRIRHAPTGELDRAHYRPMALADLMEAVNGALFLATARDASADALGAFALDRGGALLAEIRTELAGGAAHASLVTARAKRFAEVLGIAYAPALLEDLEKLHVVEHLMGLEHAVVQWIRTTTEPEAGELVALARQLPSERVSAGISKAWFVWWWRLARSCTRADLTLIVRRAVELAQTECRYGTKLAVAADACAEALQMMRQLALATEGRMWSGPPHGELDPTKVIRDDTDAHYAAYMALSHAAHALAAALRPTMDPGDANRHAMQTLAELALELLRGA